MTEQNKQLLLADLCCRLPYGVKVLIPECRQDAATLIGVDDTCFIVKYDKSTVYCPFHINIKPYLRPMSSMTEEEDKKRIELGIWINSNIKGYKVTAIEKNVDEAFDWLNAHHFDYRGLIPKGLAIEAPEGMYKMEEE